MKINETRRKDGLRIISCYLPHKKTIQVKLIARVGYAYDPPDKKGLFHCFEHMAFKGTKKRDIRELQSIDSKNLFSRNASTEALGTIYEAAVIDRKLPLACDYLCDIYFNPVFPIHELEREKRPIILEVAQIKDDDMSLAHQTLLENLYKDNPICANGGGTTESIKRIKRSDLIEQKKKWHIPSNTIAIAVGNVRHSDFVKEINKRIKRNSAKTPLKEWPDESDQLPAKKEIVIARPGRKKMILLVGCKIPENIDDRTSEAFSMFSKLIGKQPNSRLWNEIREKRGLAYTVRGSYSGSPGLGRMFFAYTEINPKERKNVEKILWKLLFRPLSEKREFKELKEIMFDAFEIGAAEQGGDYAQLIWRKVLENKPVKGVERDSKRRLKIIADMSLKDLEKARKEFIRPERFVTVVIKPSGKK